MNRTGSLPAMPSFGETPANLPLAVAAVRAALEADDISKQFGGISALDHVSLSLRPGEVHGLIGPNGSGKTTLLNLLSGYYQPTAGSIRHDGIEFAASTVQQRAPGLDFQFCLTLPPDEAGWQSIKAAAKQLGVEQRITTLGVVRITDLAKAYHEASAVYLPTLREVSTDRKSTRLNSSHRH